MAILPLVIKLFCMIKWRKISRTFVWGNGESSQVLKPIDLLIEPGEFVAILGRSGSGKSTVLSIMGLLDSATSGDYELFGDNVADLDSDARASIRNRKFGFIFQQFLLISQISVYDNVALPLSYGDSRDMKAKVDFALSSVGMLEYSKLMPYQLSGGQQQRVAIARAIVANPPIIFADEPTGSLDSVSASQVMDIFSRLNTQLGTTIIMVTHDEGWAGLSSRIIRFEDGKIKG